MIPEKISPVTLNLVLKYQPQKWAHTDQEVKGPGNTHSFTHRYLQPVAGTGGIRSDKPLPSLSLHTMGRKHTREDLDVMSDTHRCQEANRAGKGQEVKGRSGSEDRGILEEMIRASISLGCP